MFFAENLRLIGGCFFFFLLSLSKLHSAAAFLRRRKAPVSGFIPKLG